jgi:hypothetical protein
MDRAAGAVSGSVNRSTSAIRGSRFSIPGTPSSFAANHALIAAAFARDLHPTAATRAVAQTRRRSPLASVDYDAEALPRFCAGSTCGESESRHGRRTATQARAAVAVAHTVSPFFPRGMESASRGARLRGRTEGGRTPSAAAAEAAEKKSPSQRSPSATHWRSGGPLRARALGNPPNLKTGVIQWRSCPPAADRRPGAAEPSPARRNWSARTGRDGARS